MKKLRRWIRVNFPVIPGFIRNFVYIFRLDPSQCGEYSFLRNHLPRNAGKYLELGSFHPVYLSNSFSISRKGWKGISYEANSEYNLLWKIFRPGDILINKAVLPRRLNSEKTKFYFMEPGIGGTSSADRDHAHLHAERYGINFFEKEIDYLSINEVLLNFFEIFSGSPDIMLVDIEGLDLSLFEVMCSEIDVRLLPKLLLIEILNQNLVEEKYADLYSRIGNIGPNVLLELK